MKSQGLWSSAIVLSGRRGVSQNLASCRLQVIKEPFRLPIKKEMGLETIHTHGNQSTLMAPHVELPHSWMNFSMEKTPVRSSTDLPYSAWRPLSWLSALGSRESQPMWATPMTLLLRLASALCADRESFVPLGRLNREPT
jgi:hypothetical protein